MKRIYKAIILAFFAVVSANGFAADSPKSGKTVKSANPQSKQQTAQIKYLKSLSYGDCVDYLKEEMKASDDDANNRCGSIQ